MFDTRKAAKTRQQLVKDQAKRERDAEARMEALRKEHEELAKPLREWEERERQVRELSRKIEHEMRARAETRRGCWTGTRIRRSGCQAVSGSPGDERNAGLARPESRSVVMAIHGRMQCAYRLAVLATLTRLTSGPEQPEMVGWIVLLDITLRGDALAAELDAELAEVDDRIASLERRVAESGGEREL